MESDDFAPNLSRSILKSQQNYKDFASGLKGKDRKLLIEFLDKALGSRTLKGEPSLHRLVLGALKDTCGIIGDLPDSHLIDDVLLSQEKEACTGGRTADLYLGEYKNTRVAIQKFRRYGASGRGVKPMHKTFCSEIVIWKRFSHPNVLPLLGVSKDQERFYMVSEWMEHGNVNQYLKRHPGAARLQILLGIATGLKYLHDQSVIHGDLKGANIVIDKSGNVLLADCGVSSAVMESTSTVSDSRGRVGGTARWMAPELFNDEDDRVVSSREGDIYAFAMVVMEVFTGKMWIIFWKFCLTGLIQGPLLSATLRENKESFKW